MAKQVRIIDGMGDYIQGVGADTADFMNFVNSTLIESCVVRTSGLQVTEKGSGADMSVDVALGDAYILNSAWTAGSLDETRFFSVVSDAITNVTITANSSGNPRIDIIVATVDKVTPPNDEATNVLSITAVAGTPAGSPSAPATPANSVKLAEVAVSNGATSIVTANITDSRKFLSLQLEKGRLYLGTTTAPENDDPIVQITTDNYPDITAGNPGIVIQGAKNNERIALKSFGATSVASFQGVVGRGTVASPSATQSGDTLVQLRGDGIDNAAAETGLQGAVKILAAENFTTTNQGTKATVTLTPTGSITSTDIVTVLGDGQLGIKMTPEAGIDVVKGDTIESVTNVAARFRVSASAAADAGVLLGATNGNAPFVTDAPGGGTSIGMRYASSADVILSPNANGDVVEIEKHPRRSDGSSTYIDSHIQSGWLDIQGSGSTNSTGTATFNIPYSSDNIRIVATYCGQKGSAATDEAEGTFSVLVPVIIVDNITTSSFRVNLYDVVTGISSSSAYYIVHWIAIGPL